MQSVVVLVTHQLQFARAMDGVVILDETGRQVAPCSRAADLPEHMARLKDTVGKKDDNDDDNTGPNKEGELLTPTDGVATTAQNQNGKSGTKVSSSVARVTAQAGATASLRGKRREVHRNKERSASADDAEAAAQAAAHELAAEKKQEEDKAEVEVASALRGGDYEYSTKDLLQLRRNRTLQCLETAGKGNQKGLITAEVRLLVCHHLHRNPAPTCGVEWTTTFSTAHPAPNLFNLLTVRNLRSEKLTSKFASNVCRLRVDRQQ